MLVVELLMVLSILQNLKGTLVRWRHHLNIRETMVLYRNNQIIRRYHIHRGKYLKNQMNNKCKYYNSKKLNIFKLQLLNVIQVDLVRKILQGKKKFQRVRVRLEMSKYIKNIWIPTWLRRYQHFISKVIWLNLILRTNSTALKRLCWVGKYQGISITFKINRIIIPLLVMNSCLKIAIFLLTHRQKEVVFQREKVIHLSEKVQLNRIREIKMYWT